MLQFYDSTQDIPNGVKVIKVNDSFFNAHTMLRDDETTKRIIQVIDKAERTSDKTFKGRSNHFGDLDRQYLSTGTKTLLNILQNPNICFNVAECGSNALEILFTLENGMVYCEQYIIVPTNNMNQKCNISYCNSNFTNLKDFADFYEEKYDEEHPDEL